MHWWANNILLFCILMVQMGIAGQLDRQYNFFDDAWKRRD